MLRATREERRLSLRAASDLAGVSAATLSRAERGQPIAVESFLRASEFIGVTPESFLCFTTNTNCNTLTHNDSVAAPSVTAAARATS
jgi:transcriptional regulator with XRE-family HTH domain